MVEPFSLYKILLSDINIIRFRLWLVAAAVFGLKRIRHSLGVLELAASASKGFQEVTHLPNLRLSKTCGYSVR